MKNNDTLLYSGKIILEFLQSILYFPLWWYSLGLLMIVKKNLNFLRDKQRSLGVFIWIKNIFRPMYGQTDISGRLISVFMRMVQIIFRSLFMLFYTLVSFVFILLWVALPFFVFYEIVYQIYPNISLIFTNAQ
ncbi:hypothetical protein L6270_03825 [Candidatus Parcubacteria bacterium]|nr:hypothetical protein [Patescibacteria group bacterium]MBU4309092.1 hypothetical protein [Patescibacteria group bacterium]MBU4432469.1 hypothetical protein [Patescibacteria group bacterium]MBU4577453.1 hypothetical protein [Patescibacteria group bacterium]MCG2697141.1 hypothetical protein [Candidatus Parcubacteria bacterium]